MTLLEVMPLWVALAGGLGAVIRLVLDGVITRRTGSAFPVATTLINVSGSLLLGLVVGLTSATVLPETLHRVLGAGFLGGYTTFSTASVETVRLAADRRWGAALASSLGMLLASVGCAGLGLWVGGALG